MVKFWKRMLNGAGNLLNKISLVFYREKDLTAKCIIKMEGTKTSITNLKVFFFWLLFNKTPYVHTSCETDPDVLRISVLFPFRSLMVSLEIR